MNFGEAWKESLGECTKETAFAMLDYFYEQGGNFIDTAVNYQLGESEQWLGEWMEGRGRRDEMVIATKFTGLQSAAEQRQREGKFDQQGTLKGNYSGNSAKNIHTSIERSLKNLRSTYLDIVSTRVSHCMSWVDYFRSTTSIYGTTQPLYRN
jgi:aryl-alcohol dehydrogenase-like predicted oxidoreductase